MTYFRKLYGPPQSKKYGRKSSMVKQDEELTLKVGSLSQKISQSLYRRDVHEPHRSEANPYLWHMMDEVLRRRLQELWQLFGNFRSLDRNYVSRKLQECVNELDYCCEEFYHNDNDFVNVRELL